jgi:hypothetical protein
MARTLLELDTALATIEADVAQLKTDVAALTTGMTQIATWRSNVVMPALAEIQARLQRIRQVWQGLMRGEVADIDEGGAGAKQLQEQLTTEELRELRWLIAERRRATRG